MEASDNYTGHYPFYVSPNLFRFRFMALESEKYDSQFYTKNSDVIL